MPRAIPLPPLPFPPSPKIAWRLLRLLPKSQHKSKRAIVASATPVDRVRRCSDSNSVHRA